MTSLRLRTCTLLGTGAGDGPPVDHLDAIAYRHLAAENYLGGENRMAEQLELLRSPGIPIVPRGNATQP